MWKRCCGGILILTLVGGIVAVGCSPPKPQEVATPPVSPAAPAAEGQGGMGAPSEGAPEAGTTSSETGEEDRPADLHVFVPCGMIIPFNALKKVFEKENGVKVDITYDNAVVLVRKIRKGQQPDVLITPGITEMDQMKKEGYIDEKDVTTFGTFEMVVVVPKANPAGITSIQDLAEDRVKSIALADPEMNSVGYYGREVLKNLGLWDKVQSKLKVHWHALTTVDYVCGGKVDVGLYYRACPFDTAPEKVEQQTWKFAGEIPRDSYPPIKVEAGILKAWGPLDEKQGTVKVEKEPTRREMAGKLIAFLLQDTTQQLLQEKGIPNFKETK